MRVLVAGATGALATSVLSELSLAGHTAVASASDPRQRRAFLASLEGVTADAVVNLLGAGTRLPPTHRAMAATNRLRLEGTSTLLAAARRLGATRYVGATAFYGYGFGDLGDTALHEGAPFAGATDGDNAAVQRAQLGSEQQLRAFGGVVLRLGHLYGAGAEVVPPVSRSWSGSLPVIHLHDAARAAVLALDNGAAGAAYNIAAPVPATWGELQRAQSRHDGFAAPVALPDAVLRAIAPFAAQLICGSSLRLSSEAAADDLGWRARYPTLADGLPG